MVGGGPERSGARVSVSISLGAGHEVARRRAQEPRTGASWCSVYSVIHRDPMWKGMESKPRKCLRNMKQCGDCWSRRGGKRNSTINPRRQSVQPASSRRSAFSTSRASPREHDKPGPSRVFPSPCQGSKEGSKENAERTDVEAESLLALPGCCTFMRPHPQVSAHSGSLPP